MQATIIQILTTIENRKKAERVEPSHVTMLEATRELQNRFRSELEAMQQNGIVRIGRTANDNYVILTGK